MTNYKYSRIPLIQHSWLFVTWRK